MKKIKQFSLAVGLMLVLSASVFAGEIDLGKAPPPPPDPPSNRAPGDVYIPGEIHLPASLLSSGDLIMLDLLQNLLIVF